MPGLTVDTSTFSQTQTQTQTESTQPIYPPPISTSHSLETVDSQPLISSSASPSSLDRGENNNEHDHEQEHAPPYSPLTPTLAAARLSTNTTSQTHNHSNHAAISQHAIPRPAYTHSQPAQTGIAPPPPIPIAFDDNPDALALKSAISILQLQRKTAERDLKVLRRVKERAMEEPEVFVEALGRGEVKSVEGEQVLNGDAEEDEDVEMFLDGKEQDWNDSKRPREWDRLPKQQNVIRCPPVNWSQYAVVGDSLEKLHQDQLARPNEGMPQRFAEGQYYFGSEGQRRTSELSNALAAPYMPGKDKIEKMGTRKGGKR